MSHLERIEANRRLAVLKLLIEDQGHANESVLETGLIALGHYAGIDRPAVRRFMDELEKAGCVTLEFFRDKVKVAHITARGVAVAEGRITVDGVARPALGE
ncbi:MAG: VpaChn25_0724 family phage protein [Caulobacteraceae bacterium]